MSIRPPRFGQQAAERAHDEWGCNCGPGAIAAICHLTLDEVRPLISGFEKKGYTNPTMMIEALDRIGVRWRSRALASNVPKLDFPKYGLARIQWEGPWSAAGMNPRWGYRHSHWVGAARKIETIGIFDINCMQNGSGWVDLLDWQEMVVPWILKSCVPRANGKWHITHAIEVAL
jgi:hypothetical protein